MSILLPAKDPTEYLCNRGWGAWSPSDRVELPVYLHTAGGTHREELLYLATVTRLLQPRKIFEIGTFMGAMTSVFILNAPADAEII